MGRAAEIINGFEQAAFWAQAVSQGSLKPLEARFRGQGNIAHHSGARTNIPSPAQKWQPVGNKYAKPPSAEGSQVPVCGMSALG